MLIYEEKPKDFSPAIDVAAIYLNIGDKLLLLELSPNKEEKGAWSVPAGKIDPEERPVQGAKRELFEETGVKVEFEDSFIPLGVLYMRRPKLDYVYHLFAVNLKCLPAIHLSSEHTSCRWVTREEAKSLPLMKGANLALDAYFERLANKC